jgi:flavin-dependent thymidylate synthase
VTKEVQRWADQAMFSAEPMIVQKPMVHLLSMNPDPLGQIAAAAKMYLGQVVRDLADITDEERVRFFEDGTKTVLGAPFETVQFHFMIDGVTRGFTHQLVRQRTATYFQESTRFAVIDETFSDRVGIPPSLEGTQPAPEFYADCQMAGVDPETNASERQRWRNRWDEVMEHIHSAYSTNVNEGMPAEDARGMLPTNLLTRVHYRTNLRDLIQHAGNRLCTQAQFEWRYVFGQIVDCIKNAEVQIPIGNGGSHRAPVYMRERLAGLFAPVCYQQGKCGFKASFDRACTIRGRADAFAEHGVPSSRWHEGVLLDDPDNLPEGQETARRLLPIYPAEWALDDAAARS